MTVEYVATRDVPLSRLTLFPGNARQGNVKQIRESIRRHGQYRSLVVRDTGGALVVLAGNNTLAALTAERHRTARCEVVRCDDAEARRINLADNRLPELARWDLDALAELLSYLDDDYAGTGYSDGDVQRLITPVEPPQAADDPAGVPVDAPAACPRCGHPLEGGPANQ